MQTMKKYLLPTALCVILTFCLLLAQWYKKRSSSAKSVDSSITHYGKDLRARMKTNAPPAWMMQQIKEDLASIQQDDLSLTRLDELMRQDAANNGRYGLVRYQIRKHQLEMITLPDFMNQCRAVTIKKCLNEILSITPLPDLDFVMSLHDAADGWQLTAPVFAYAKNSTLHEPIILMPDFEALSGNEPFHRQVNKGAIKYPWKQKKSQGFWRGAMTGSMFTVDNFLQAPRSQLISVSLANPEWIDAKYAMLTQCVDPDQIRSAFADYFGELMSIKNHLAYKYQILVDGNSCAYSRAYWQLFSNCLIFKQESPHIQWYYRALQPHVHYIPVHSDFSNLIEKMQWASEHDAAVEKIAHNAQRFAQDNLHKADVHYYMALLLQEYAKVQHAATQTQ